jgi:phenylacetate-coenzyme A ligase PaaK-like adenylate-forming protein
LNSTVKNKIFTTTPANFKQRCLETFQFQYENNVIYQQYCNALSINIDKINEVAQIPFLPISFFKTHDVITTKFEPQLVFESSGTTQTVNSKHAVKDIEIYKESFNACFTSFYGDVKNWCVIGLLPSYLERQNSSLIFMVDDLIKQSNHVNSGFYLYDTKKLYQTILQNEQLQQPTLLFGVTYALLDFADEFTMQLKYTTIIETGGMKGRKEEMTRQQIHQVLKTKLGVAQIHSEYGMTELLSQAYATKDGMFYCPASMKILIREEDDPFAILQDVSKPKTGLINVIDLANIYSCSFIATDDVGRLHANGGVEILGRKDNSDLRGCSLLSIN